LTPRPDTETLVEAALAWAALDRVDGGGAHGTVLDFGTGSGCLLLSLLAEWPDARGVGVDISPQALAVAAGNARAAGLDGRATFVLSDWGAALGDARFDVIVANPPYIPDGDIDGLAPEVARHEPRLALSGGADGLDAYRLLANETARRLHPGGAAFFELGIGQADAVAGLMAAAGLAPLGLREDLSGVVRCLAVRANY
ncbi:MAG: HemK family protein methyltransferase, partial [Rhodobacterales bacterium]|nr:HemK family protein methyltransferase [Rhodobacterales bacterium]